MSMEYGFGQHCTSCLPEGGEDKKPVDTAVATYAGQVVVEPDGRKVTRPQGYLPGDEGSLAFIAKNTGEAVIISGAD